MISSTHFEVETSTVHIVLDEAMEYVIWMVVVMVANDVHVLGQHFDLLRPPEQVEKREN